MTKIYIDGSAGTTGLRIHDRLKDRQELEFLTLPAEFRKDNAARKEIINEADIVFFCLPDAAATEAAEMTGENTCVIDTSTAHRTADGWVYGFPELKGQREKIQRSNRIANPGCHASGFISLVEPLVREKLISPDTTLTCFSVTGYSGGGRKMIEEYESTERDKALQAPRQYALAQSHKHLKEMQQLCRLSTAPVFCPIVADYYSGMAVTVSLFQKDLRGNAEDIKALYRETYNSKIVHFEGELDGMIPGNLLADRDDMAIGIAGNGERILLISVFDNLGKGASGAAIQNMNLLLGLEESTGLVL